MITREISRKDISPGVVIELVDYGGDFGSILEITFDRLFKQAGGNKKVKRKPVSNGMLLSVVKFSTPALPIAVNTYDIEKKVCQWGIKECYIQNGWPGVVLSTPDNGFYDFISGFLKGYLDALFGEGTISSIYNLYYRKSSPELPIETFLYRLFQIHASNVPVEDLLSKRFTVEVKTNGKEVRCFIVGTRGCDFKVTITPKQASNVQIINNMLSRGSIPIHIKREFLEETATMMSKVIETSVKMTVDYVVNELKDILRGQAKM